MATSVQTVHGYEVQAVEAVARFGRLDVSSSGGIYSYVCSLVHSELSWWGLKSSLHLHLAHTHYGSHYSSTYFIKQSVQRLGCLLVRLVNPRLCKWQIHLNSNTTSSMHVHGTHMLYCSHYSIKSPY
jgi:hypothetical protein